MTKANITAFQSTVLIKEIVKHCGKSVSLCLPSLCWARLITTRLQLWYINLHIIILNRKQEYFPKCWIVCNHHFVELESFVWFWWEKPNCFLLYQCVVRACKTYSNADLTCVLWGNSGESQKVIENELNSSSWLPGWFAVETQKVNYIWVLWGSSSDSCRTPSVLDLLLWGVSTRHSWVQMVAIAISNKFDHKKFSFTLIKNIYLYIWVYIYHINRDSIKEKDKINWLLEIRLSSSYLWIIHIQSI